MAKKPSSKLKIKPQKLKKSFTNKALTENVSTVQSQKSHRVKSKPKEASVSSVKQKENINKVNNSKKVVKNSDKMKDIYLKNKAVLKPQKQT
jgi:hypothetical protein